MRLAFPSSLCALGLVAVGWSAAPSREPLAFEELSMTLEVNATDGHCEVILQAETGLPLDQLAVIAPDGRVVQRLDAATPGGIGLTELRLASGVPSFEALVAAYPEGRYLVRARTIDGHLVTGAAELAHALPARWLLGAPRLAAVASEGDSLVVTWEAGEGAEHFTVEVVDEEDDETRFKATPPGPRTSLRVPAELLEHDHLYQVIVTAYAEGGNRLLQERGVRTAP